ncbi:Protein eva-1 like C [Dissostichus eleginoides]|uniref:Protein eva-1 like C n=1 Tax=Dissostichus eleginoides TaxID=100907 RepID=A0AAD9BV40_DISEL|nr:Protein eva-1 like C [Dissostichus eleginoides]
MFFSDGTLSAVTYALLLGITCVSVLCDLTKGSSDLSGYLSKVLRNYSEEACDGDFLSVRCPPRTTITVQSAFYGRKGASDPKQCPQSYQALFSSYNPREDDRYCSVSTALQKMLDECQDRRSCQVLVNSRVFGTDQCPGSSKYLIVWYKCRPNEYKSKVVCEEERMRLSCKRGMQIAVYSAMFGRTQQGTLECPLHHRRAPSVGRSLLAAWRKEGGSTGSEVVGGQRLELHSLVPTGFPTNCILVGNSSVSAPAGECPVAPSNRGLDGPWGPVRGIRVEPRPIHIPTGLSGRFSPLYLRSSHLNCQSSVALQVLTSRCQGRKSCLVRASSRDFGDPCYSGTRKYLNVIYTCGESQTPLLRASLSYHQGAMSTH